MDVALGSQVFHVGAPSAIFGDRVAAEGVFGLVRNRPTRAVSGATCHQLIHSISSFLSASNDENKYEIPSHRLKATKGKALLLAFDENAKAAARPAAENAWLSRGKGYSLQRALAPARRPGPTCHSVGCKCGAGR